MRRLNLRADFLSVFLLLAVLMAGCRHSGAPSMPWDRASVPAVISLTDLHNVEEFQARFSQDAGKPRLVLLVSPT